MKIRIKKEYLTAPNLLSLYRIIVFPLILWFILANNETLFAIFLIINLITDILDGLIARLLKMQTELGAKLDSTGDIGTYILAFIGIFVFKWDVIAPHILPFLVFAGLCIVLVILAWIKFGKVPSFHLYSWKVGGYIQGFFFFTLFAFDFYPVLYYFMTFWSIFAALEHIIIQLIIPQMRSNVKGLYWVLRDHQKRKGQ